MIISVFSLFYSLFYFLINQADSTFLPFSDMDIQHSETESSIYVIVFFLIIIIVLLAVVLYQYWVIQIKNRRIFKFILKVSKIPYVNFKLSKRSSVGHTSKPTSGNKQNPSSSKRKVSDKDRVLFEQFDKIVHLDKLYLNYKLGRDDYARLMKVDKNRFAAIIKEYGGGNLSTYLSNLRLEYSIELLQSEQKMTINEISSKCAFPNVTTFHRLFKEKYGESPNVYRKKYIH